MARNATISQLLAIALLGLTVLQAPAVRAQPEGPPWDWTDAEVFEAVNQVRAGRDMTPDAWPDGARVAVLLSFDVDNETVHGLRNGEISIGPLSEGEYGARAGLPRIARRQRSLAAALRGAACGL